MESADQSQPLSTVQVGGPHDRDNQSRFAHIEEEEKVANPSRRQSDNESRDFDV